MAGREAGPCFRLFSRKARRAARVDHKLRLAVQIGADIGQRADVPAFGHGGKAAARALGGAGFQRTAFGAPIADAAIEDRRIVEAEMQIGRATSELQSLMRISSAVFCLHKQKSPPYTKDSKT